MTLKEKVFKKLHSIYVACKCFTPCKVRIDSNRASFLILWKLQLFTIIDLSRQLGGSVFYRYQIKITQSAKVTIAIKCKQTCNSQSERRHISAGF